MNLTLTLPEPIIVRLQRRARELNVALDDLAWKFIPSTKTIAEVVACWDANPPTEEDTPPDEWDDLWANFEACNQFASLVHAVEENSVIEITRRGEPVAVILSIHEYRTLKGVDKDFWVEYLKFCKNNDVKEDSLKEDEFANLRDRTPGREVNLMNWHNDIAIH